MYGLKIKKFMCAFYSQNVQKSSGRKPGRNVTLTTTTTTTSTWYFEDVDYQLKGYRERGCSGKWEKLKDMISN